MRSSSLAATLRDNEQWALWPDGAWAVIWQTTWDTAEDAAEFAAVATESMAALADIHIIAPEDFTTVMMRTVLIPDSAEAPDEAGRFIDHLIETPMPEGPIVLHRPNVLYEFADPDLEALSSGQKLLIRMGNDHATRVL